MKAGAWVVPGIMALALASSQMAYATAELRLTDGTNTVDILDNGGAGTCVGISAADCVDDNTNSNVVTFNGTIGNWTVNVSTGSSHGESAGFDLDLNSLNTTSGASTLTILFSDDGFLNGFRALDVGGTASNTSITDMFSAYEGGSKFAGCSSLPNPGTCTGQIGSTLTFTAPGAFLSTAGSGIGTALTEAVVLTATGPSQTSFDLSIAPVPEPSGVALFGAVLGTFVVFLRRKLVRS